MLRTALASTLACLPACLPAGRGAPVAGAWGVTSLPTGMDEASVDPKLLAIIAGKQAGKNACIYFIQR